MNNKIFLFTLLLFTLFSCSSNNVKYTSIDDYQKTYKVNSWSISSDDKYVWVLESKNNAMLSFKMPWRIIELYHKEGDFVNAWDLLWVLDGNEIKTKYTTTLNMINSLNNLYSSTKKAFDSQIEAMQEKVKQVEYGVQWVQSWAIDTKNITDESLVTIDKKIKQAKLWVETAKEVLDNLKSIFKQNEENVYLNSKTAMANSKILLNNLLIFSDQLFSISEKNKYTNKPFNSYLSARDSNLKNEIKNDWPILNDKKNKWQEKTDKLLFDINNSSDLLSDEDLKKRIFENLQDTRDLLISSRELFSKIYTALDDSIPNTHFSQKTINSYKTKVTTFQQNIEKALLTTQWNFLLWVKWSIEAIQNLNKQKEMKLDLAQKKYELAQSQLNTVEQMYKQAQATVQWKINQVNTKLNVSKKQYEEIKKWLQALKEKEKAQLSQISTQINQVKWNKNLAAVNLWNIKLYAPYSWVITKKIADVGQVVWPGRPIYSISDPTKIKWVFYIPVEDIEKIKKWQTIIIEWLNTTLTWSVSVIYPSADHLSKKVPIDVSINSIPKNWKLGMFITGYLANSKFDWLVIPQNFIYYEYWKAYIYKSNNWSKYKKTYIELWKCNDDFCIVKRWLEKNDIIK